MHNYFTVDSDLASFGMVLNMLSFFIWQYDWISN